MFWGQKAYIHLIGIGGSGMSGIAEVLLASGFPVSGSDLNASITTDRLQKLGAKFFLGHSATNIENATCVVVSSAISSANPELVQAQRKGIPTIARAEMLAELMRLKLGVAIAGSHGKTTTTSMVGQVLKSIDPTVVVGGRLQHWNASSIVGKGSAFVIEADESDRSFLKFSPVYSVVTNIDREHLDTYRDLEDIEQTFLEFLNRTAFFGMNWICADCPSLVKLKAGISKPTKTYGLSESADLKIVNLSFEERSSRFELIFGNQHLGAFVLPVVGRHNVLNAAAAVGIALSFGLSLNEIQKGLRSFVPADRRLQVHFEDSNWALVEDYGHHPTEIAATLDAIGLMYPSARVHVYFQPHRYSRTQALFSEFTRCFENRADEIFILPIYAAHEKPIAGITSEILAKSFASSSVRFLGSAPTPESILSSISASSQKQVVVILGAGPLTSLATALRACLESSDSQARSSI